MNEVPPSPNHPRRVAILGATGSIGTSTLQVLRQNTDCFELVGVAARTLSAGLRSIVDEFRPQAVALTQTDDRVDGADFPGSGTKVLTGTGSLTELVESTRPDLLVVAIVGTAALEPTVRALELGVDVALASKEILVLAGSFVLAAAELSGARLLPLDSEHNAVFQCLQAGRVEDLGQIVLTASGGPFRQVPLEKMADVRPAEALRHPNWSMGPKITIDSATMANKGLEVIEAARLFGLRSEQVQVIVHPESVVHSFIEWKDGSVLAQLSPPDMRFAIQHCLFFPFRGEPPAQRLDWQALNALHFEQPDLKRFPCLALAYEALRQDGLFPGIFNTANEVAVEAFLQEKIPFLAIPRLIEHCMSSLEYRLPDSLSDLIQIEAEVRRFAQEQADVRVSS